MNEKTTAAEPGDAPGDPVQQATGTDRPATRRKADPVRRWTFIVLALVLILLACYLRADRVTPFTDQARVNALVVPIAPEVSGTITAVNVTNNQAVKQGDPLFQIGRERYEYALQNAQATLEQARQAQGAAQANVDSARASVESARATEEKTRLDVIRMRTIREEDPGALSLRRLESAEASLISAQSRVTSAQAALAAALEQLGEPGDANAAVQQALAGLETARLNLERTTVRAPMDGVVTGVQLDTGNFANAGAAQLTFIATHHVWIQADYTENNLGHITPGDPVGIIFDSYPGQVFAGTVGEIGFGVSVNSPPLGQLPTIRNDSSWLRQPQRYPVLIRFELPRDADGRTLIKVGSQASVTVYTGDHPLFNPLARVMLKIASWLSYAY